MVTEKACHRQGMVAGDSIARNRVFIDNHPLKGILKNA